MNFHGFLIFEFLMAINETCFITTCANKVLCWYKGITVSICLSVCLPVRLSCKSSLTVEQILIKLYTVAVYRCAWSFNWSQSEGVSGVYFCDLEPTNCSSYEMYSSLIFNWKFYLTHQNLQKISPHENCWFYSRSFTSVLAVRIESHKSGESNKITWGDLLTETVLTSELPIGEIM